MAMNPRNISATEPLLALASVLRGNDSGHTIGRTMPPGEQLPFLEAIGNPMVASGEQSSASGELIRSEIDGCLTRLARFEQLSRCPLVAVAGQLNAGKSSLVSTFLSAAARNRIPRGLANELGTHRFVIWMPARWRDDPDLLKSLHSTLGELFGQPPELLSEATDEAHQAYVQAAQAATPLLAFDEGLDGLGLGLIDCPDIQSGFTLASGSAAVSGHIDGEALPEIRQQQLRAMAKLCSAFVVVCGMRSLHDHSLVDILQTLRDAMPGVPRYLAVNRVKARYSATSVLQQSRLLSDRFHIKSTYLAYDYRSPAAQELIPRPPEELRQDSTAPLPVFFEATSDGHREQSIAPPMPPRYLLHIGNDLDVGYLARESSRTLVLQLNNETRRAINWVDACRDANLSTLQRLWGDIAEACIAFMAERGGNGAITGLRMQTSPTIINQLTESLARTAPTWMRASMKIDRIARKMQMAVKNSTARLAALGNVTAGVKNVIRKFRSGDGAAVVTPSKLASSLRERDRMGGLEYLTDQHLAAQCDIAMKRFMEEDKTTLDVEQLDEWSAQVWTNMPVRKKLWKGAQPFAMLAAPFAAVILLPIDGGGSAVLVFASAKELIAAAGIATLLGPTQTGHLAFEVAQGETAWRQLSNLFALCCDSLGLPRPDASQMPEVFDGREQRCLAASSISSDLHSLELSPSVWDCRPELRAALNRLLSDAAAN